MKVSIIMGSKSDLPTMENAMKILEDFSVEYEAKIVSAHRTPEYMVEFAKQAKENNISIIIAGAGGAAHLPGMVASLTTLPVIGVPVKSKTLNGVDSLLSIVQMPGGVPVATMSIGESGAKNAALMAIRILSLQDKILEEKMEKFMCSQKERVLNEEL
ncbi:5-(carboxyamino)imidazole ribonucleotide mutase [Mycoplasma todarodis]|uniref:N5-carboxyaminoimidazole ribonucleotide mutase n=1 Tax=Mycoplasma todarodis TaxID=1937191 RepID=A0A4R0XTJ7_9MOLU|nr:5-(carboxyamino)imidazole ribonucleotide mutase [Mycoplasma todarodis]TCG11087.1 5-(carboxyamino)imidazole ribonucleotide mutase [Mycoplasma todarodis]